MKTLDPGSLFDAGLARRRGYVEVWGPAVRGPFLELVGRLLETLASGGKVLLCGNGGSASQAQHFAAELVGRFKRERSALPAIALNADTSALTAIGNDYGFETVFRRQAEALMAPGDLLLGLSTSGDSPNVVTALEWARGRGYATAALTGEGGGRMAAHSDVLVAVPSRETDLIQECHLALLHLLAEAAEDAFTDRR
jgi:D-sedoheptulose 7-phosphate isomerase